ncbi:MAG: PPC domain-containing DNA-binding protein [Acutalibacteraceae bacterium]
MKTKKLDNTIAVRLDIGDEICSCVEKICREYNIKAGTVQGIGTTDNAEIGVYNLQKRRFIGNEIHEFMEITNLCGNVSQMDGQTYIHLHATLGDKDGKAYGGHLKSAVVAATAELFITDLGGQIERRYDETTGLNIFSF